MKYVLVNYNHLPDWVMSYTEDFIVFDRSESSYWTRALSQEKVVKTKNIGSDIYDKLTYIIKNYDNLPEVAVYSKSNLFKYMSKPEFDKVKDNKEFTPLLTQNHRTYKDPEGQVCYYKDGLYYERNNRWYLGALPAKHNVDDLMHMLGIKEMAYVPFAPGSGYILPKENILQHSKEFYEKLRGYLDWGVYPGEAQVIERGLYTIWK